MSVRNRQRLLFCVVAPVVLVFGVVLIADYVQERGQTFFNTGKHIVETLQQLAWKVQAKDVAAVERFYTADFRGNRLGLTRLQAAEEKDGVRRLTFVAETQPIGRAEALAEWRAYLDSFDSIEEVGLHLHRLEDWGSPTELVSTVRFELIGTPRGAARSSIDRGLFRVKWTASGDDLKIREVQLIEGDRFISDTSHFVNVAAAAGVDFLNQYYPPFLTEPLRFGMIRYGPAGITAVDYDNDGFYDLFIPDGVQSKLFRNRGDGAFEDVTHRVGLGGLDGASVGVFADYDNDGHKDFFVSRTFRHNQLFHNNGDGTFENVTERAGLFDPTAKSLGVALLDFDEDGWIDLFVPNDTQPNKLYRNNGNGTFAEVGLEAGVAFSEAGVARAGMGVDAADYDGSGRQSLIIGNFSNEMMALYHNEGTGLFVDEAPTSTIGQVSLLTLTFACFFFDYDLDGLLDIFAVNGHVADDIEAVQPKVKYAQPPHLLMSPWVCPPASD
jgi:hypothetical protein